MKKRKIKSWGYLRRRKVWKQANGIGGELQYAKHGFFNIYSYRFFVAWRQVLVAFRLGVAKQFIFIFRVKFVVCSKRHRQKQPAPAATTRIRATTPEYT